MEDIVKDTVKVGVPPPLTLTLGDVVLDKHSEGVSDWVENELSVTVMECVPLILLQLDTEALADWLTLRVEVIVPEAQLDDEKLGDGEIEGEVVPVKQRVGEADWVEEVLNELERLPEGEPEEVI